MSPIRFMFQWALRSNENEQIISLKKKKRTNYVGIFHHRILYLDFFFFVFIDFFFLEVEPPTPPLLGPDLGQVNTIHLRKSFAIAQNLVVLRYCHSPIMENENLYKETWKTCNISSLITNRVNQKWSMQILLVLDLFRTNYKNVNTDFFAMRFH